MSDFRMILRQPDKSLRGCPGNRLHQTMDNRPEIADRPSIAIANGQGSINLGISLFTVVVCLLIEMALPMFQSKAWGQSSNTFGFPSPTNQTLTNQASGGEVFISNRRDSMPSNYPLKGDFATERPYAPDQKLATPRLDIKDYHSVSPNNWETWGPSNPVGNRNPQVSFQRGNPVTDLSPHANNYPLDRIGFFQPDSVSFADPGSSQVESNRYPSSQLKSMPPASTELNRSELPNSPFQTTSHGGGRTPSTNPSGQNQPHEVPPMPTDIRQDLKLPQRSSSAERALTFPPLDESSPDDERSLLEGIEPEVAKPSISSNPETSAYSDSLTRALMQRFDQQKSQQLNQQRLQGTMGGQPIYSDSSTASVGSAPSMEQPIDRFNLQPAVQTAPHVPMSAWGSVEPNFRPDLGHRAPYPVQRNLDGDDYGQPFDFEEKKEDYPSLKEIFVTGRYFGSASLQFIKPVFQGNAAVTQEISGLSESFQFGYDEVPRFQVGFESRFGPGVELDFWTLNDTSRVTTFLSNGGEAGTLSVLLDGTDRISRLTAGNLGERLNARHRLRLDSAGASFFKEVPLKRSRINGKFGVHAIRLTQETRGDLFNNAGLQTDSLFARSDLRAFGPQFNLEYFRPVGHTPVEFLTSVGGSLMFGKRSNFVTNTMGDNFARFDAREFIATTDFFAGGQYRRLVAENRYWFLRFGFNYQVWFNGGSAVSTGDDFGLRGFTLTAGYNR